MTLSKATRVSLAYAGTVGVVILTLDLLLVAFASRELWLSELHLLIAALTIGMLYWMFRRELIARHMAEAELQGTCDQLEVRIAERTRELAEANASLQSLTTDLQEKQLILNAIMENTRTHLAYLDADMCFRWVNFAYARGCGYPREALIGRNHFDVFPNEENQRIFERVRDTRIRAEFHAKPFTFPDHPERGVTYWDWTLVPMLDDTGEVVGFAFSLMDVTAVQRTLRQRERYLAKLDLLLRTSEDILREHETDRLFMRVADAARIITDARVCIAGTDTGGNRFMVRAASRAEGAPLCHAELARLADAPPELPHVVMKPGAHVRISKAEMESDPRWAALPPGHYPLRGLLSVHMARNEAADAGIILVSDKEQGDFTEEDEALLSELGVLTALALQHIDARVEAEHHANELDTVFAAMTNGVIVYDTTGTAISVNPASIAIMGFDARGLKMQEIHARLHLRHGDVDVPVGRELPAYRALRGETIIGARMLLRNQLGMELNVRASVAPLRSGGEIVGAVAVWTDETERERLIVDLEEEQARLTAIIDTAPVGIVVLDDQASVRRLNPAAARMQLHRVPILFGGTEAGSGQLQHEDGRPFQFQEFPIVRSALYGERHNDVAIQMQCSNGSHYHLLCNSAPIHDMAGSVTGAVGIFRDNTTITHDAERIMQREQEYHMLMEQASDGILILNGAGRITAINSRMCRMLEQPREELLDILVTDLIAPEDTGAFEVLKADLREEHSLILEHRVRKSDGSLLHVETSACLLSDGRAQASVRDITERKAVEEEFTRAVRTHVFDRLFGMMGEIQHGEAVAMNLHRIALFARNIRTLAHEEQHGHDSAHARLAQAIHEFESLSYHKLVGIASLLRVVEEEFTADGKSPGDHVSGSEVLVLTNGLLQDTDQLLTITSAELPADVRNIEQTGVQIAEHAETLSRKLIEMSRELNLHFTSSVTDVVRRLVTTLAPTMPEIDIELEEPTDLQAVIDAAGLTEVLSLLVSNARDALCGGAFTPDERGRRLRISFALHDRDVHIMVDDSGPGVPTSLRERIFEHGFSTKSGPRGHGLEYALDHLMPYGGDITCSDSPLGGARFTVSLVSI